MNQTDLLGLFFCCAGMAKKSKKISPAGKFGLVFGLLGFWVLIF
ncbi:hypothetical protein ACTWKB_21180 [Bacillus sp. 4A_MP2]